MPKRESNLTTATLVQELIQDIRSRDIIDDKDKLPTEPELMTRYGVTRYTLRQALAQLSTLGYIYQAHGIGTFGRPRQDHNMVSIQSAVGLTEDFERQGKKLTTVKYSLKQTTAAKAVFNPLSSEIDPATPLWEIRRYRALDGQPYMFEHSYYLSDIVGRIPVSAVMSSLFSFVANNDKLKLGFQDKVVEATALTEETAWFFNEPVGTPMLTMNDDSYLSSGQLFAFSKLSYDHRLGKFFMFTRL